MARSRGRRTGDTCCPLGNCPSMSPCLIQTSYSESPISQVFGGELLSIVQKQGSKESATVELFFALPLDIQVRSTES